MRTHRIVLSTLAAALVAATLTPARASAQLAAASASTLGLAGNVTARARGIGAISANPAGLGMPGSGFTLALLPIQARPGLGPITLKDLKDFQGVDVPVATKQAWLDEVKTQGSQSGSAGAEVTEVALAMGRIGLQVSTIVGAQMSLAPDVVELLLFGNAGRIGSPVTTSLSGSSVEAFAISTVGGSFAIPLKSANGDMAVGATLKYSAGHFMANGQVTSGSFTANPLEVKLTLPVITIPDSDADPVIGSGIGLDLGFQMHRGTFGLGAAVLNVVNTFKWKDDKLVYRPGTASWNQNSSTDDFDEQPFGNAPTSNRQLVDDMKFDPALAVGASLDLSEVLTVSADLQNRFGDGIELGPKFHLGAGGEYRGLKVLHVRAGAAAVTGGVELAGGASLVLGPVSLSGAAAKRSGDIDTQMAQFTLSFGGR